MGKKEQQMNEQKGNGKNNTRHKYDKASEQIDFIRTLENE